MKNKGNQFRSIEEKHENFIAAVKKRDIKGSGHQGENERQCKKKKRKQEHIQHFLHKTCN